MKILFISHDAHLAGAQILLLNLLKWIKKYHAEIEFDVLLTGEGILTADFEKLTNVFKMPLPKERATVLDKIIYKLKLKFFYNDISHKKYDLIYNNTFSNGELSSVLELNKIPIITHVHELEYWIKKNGVENLNRIKASTSYYLAASKSVKNYLLKNNIADINNVEVVYEWIDSQLLLQQSKNKSIRFFLNLPEDSIIIAASGRENFRKGKDWFIPIAIQVLTKIKSKKIHFVWIGGHTAEELVFDCIKSNFQNNIHFIEHIPEANTYFNEFEVFMMLSREDPFPLVNLEAAIWQVPIICFENTGGTEELVSENCGIKVPYGNLNMFAEAIIRVIENEQFKNEMGMNIKEKVLREYDINVVGEKIIKAIFKVIENHAK
ncbi:glycosyltransferase family 4 protein [Flavobacterium aquiphilum]|uniref:glycosyltransferase family 4 protein n=1 Tax=Flavobacterium aquiphilum TaxID=3003261 RepID=UPI0024818FB2|nr:glycosyltransferase family 4 protein [Flavobacterium aquiphilum]